jgi:hypothetical protein
MARSFLFLALLFSCIGFSAGQDIPAQLQGKWIIKRILPTSTISCWSYKEARRIVGTEIEYTANSFRWKDKITSNPVVTVTTLDAERLHDENSGGGANDSQVSFRELGIGSATLTEVRFSHRDASITGATIEVPGDRVLLKAENTLILSVCNVYFEARRKSVSAGPRN